MGKMAHRIHYTARFLVGIIVTGAIAYLGYWLLAVYRVENVLGIAAIFLFIGAPLLNAIFLSLIHI